MSSSRRGGRSRSKEARIKMSDPRLWVAGLVALPVLVIGFSFFRLDVERPRRVAVASALAQVLRRSLGAQLGPRLGGHRSRRHAVGGANAVRGQSVAADGRGDAARGAGS